MGTQYSNAIIDWWLLAVPICCVKKQVKTCFRHKQQTVIARFDINLVQINPIWQMVLLSFAEESIGQHLEKWPWDGTPFKINEINDEFFFIFPNKRKESPDLFPIGLETSHEYYAFLPISKQWWAAISFQSCYPITKSAGGHMYDPVNRKSVHFSFVFVLLFIFLFPFIEKEINIFLDKKFCFSQCVAKYQWSWFRYLHPSFQWLSIAICWALPLV